MATEWKKIKLGDIATFSNGINFGKESYRAGVKLIGVSNFGNRFFPDYEELEEVDENVLRPNDYLKNGDIVFVRSNGNKELVGRCMLIQNPPSTVTYSGFCIRARLNNIDENCPSFFAYYFKSKDFRKAMSNTAVGANIQNLNQGLLSNHIFYLPPLETQQKIAGILSAYDDLIENNRKQIKLLEEAAQKLYKEWFVKLNFPGHENVKIVDGVPEGWKKEKVGNIIKTLPKTKQVKTAETLSNGEIPVIDQSRDFIAGYTNDKETIIKSESPVIVFGDHTRILKLIQFPFARGADGTQVFISINNCIKEYQLYCALVEIDLSNYSYARHFKYLKEQEILIPTKELSEKFETFVKSNYQLIQKLRDKIQLLQSARDKLLPKLMNGEFELDSETSSE